MSADGPSPIDFLEYCRVRYRTCWSYAKWVAARLVGAEEEPEADTAEELYEWLRGWFLEKLSEEERSEYRSALEEEAERLAAEALRRVVYVLSRQYG